MFEKYEIRDKRKNLKSDLKRTKQIIKNYKELLKTKENLVLKIENLDVNKTNESFLVEEINKNELKFFKALSLLSIKDREFKFREVINKIYIDKRNPKSLTNILFGSGSDFSFLSDNKIREKINCKKNYYKIKEKELKKIKHDTRIKDVKVFVSLSGLIVSIISFVLIIL